MDMRGEIKNLFEKSMSNMKFLTLKSTDLFSLENSAQDFQRALAQKKDFIIINTENNDECKNHELYNNGLNNGHLHFFKCE